MELNLQKEVSFGKIVTEQIEQSSATINKKSSIVGSNSVDLAI
jgi:hypothetical protein